MLVFKRAPDLHNWLEQQRQSERTIGFVPTMGALHDGHLHLIKASLQRTSITVCSIFVNPTQFNDQKDFQKYPVTIEKDIDQLISTGTDVLFLPSVEEVYPDGMDATEEFDLNSLNHKLEGAFRPGHFDGVCQVVSRFLSIVEPNVLFLGQKDYQQCLVIKKMIKLKNYPVEVQVCSTLRESDGLAMSSRNTRLNVVERNKAVAIPQMLQMLQNELSPGNLNNLQEKGKQYLIDHGFNHVDYVSFANTDTLEPVSEWDGEQELMILTAATIGDVRLIDNMVAH